MSAIRELAYAKVVGGNGGGGNLPKNYVELDFSSFGGSINTFNGYQTNSSTQIMDMRQFSKRIVLSNVYELSASAFQGCPYLESVEIPEVTSIGSSAFVGCSSLKSISLPKVTSIGSTAFAATGLEYVYIGPDCTTINPGAFGNVPVATCKVECGFAEGAVSGFPSSAGWNGNLADLDITYNVPIPRQ